MAATIIRFPVSRVARGEPADQRPSDERIGRLAQQLHREMQSLAADPEASVSLQARQLLAAMRTASPAAGRLALPDCERASAESYLIEFAQRMRDPDVRAQAVRDAASSLRSEVDAARIKPKQLRPVVQRVVDMIEAQLELPSAVRSGTAAAVANRIDNALEGWKRE